MSTATSETAVTSEAADWEAWRASRLEAATEPHGIASVRATVWLDEQPTEIPGAPGLWSSDGSLVHATGAAEVQLRAGESARLGDVLVRALQRNGLLAVRILDPAAANRTSLEAIEAYAWDPAWRLTGSFAPAPEHLRVDQADGGETEFPVAGRLSFDYQGATHSLIGFRTDQGLQITFADPTNGEGTAQFRFIDVDLPAGHDATQDVVIDFNRAYLPPCSFAQGYLCPLPPAGNHLAVAVTAGEQRQRYSESRDGTAAGL